MMTPFESAVRGSLEESRGGRTHVHYRNDLGDRATPLSGTQLLADELADEYGIRVGENRVHRLCRIAGISASHHKKRSKAGATGPPPHDDVLAVVDEHGVVRHEFAADAPNKVWLWDISEHPTREGKL